MATRSYLELLAADILALIEAGELDLIAHTERAQWVAERAAHMTCEGSDDIDDCFADHLADAGDDPEDDLDEFENWGSGPWIEITLHD